MKTEGAPVRRQRSVNMSWLFELHRTQPVAQGVGVLPFICVVATAVCSLKFRGIGLSTAGVLFAAIGRAEFSEAVDSKQA